MEARKGEIVKMAGHASSKQGRLWLILLGALVAALVSLLALLHWDSPARATEQTGSGNELTPERSDTSFEEELAEAIGEDDFQTQIVGGKPVPNGKYPFMAVLLVGSSDGSTSLCGGTLIDRDSVLTAGHCLVNARSVRLAVGRTVISKPQGKVRAATRWFSHPRFDLSNNFSYDVAVLKLDRAVRGIKPIKLSTASQDNLETPGRKLTVAGWGTTSEGGRTSDRMREVRVPVVSDAKAKRAYSSEPPVLRYFPKLMVAAGKEGKDSCQGDSGGPLFNRGANNTTQVGIVSYGRGCARATFPGVYTEVNNPNIRSFIVNAAQK